MLKGLATASWLALAPALAVAQVADAPPPETTSTAAEAAPSAMPMATPAATLPVVLTTAQHRVEPLQTVPLAITLFDARALEARRLQSVLAVVGQVPNAFATSHLGQGSAGSITIRGLGSSDSIATRDPAVGLYLDDIPITRQNLNQFGLLAVDRIEVLRGPQGTLLGRNTTGGAINVRLTEPGRRLGGFGEFRWGAYDLIAVRGAFDLPLSDAIGIQLSGYSQNDDGYVSNRATGERLNDSDGNALRLAARIDLAPELRWRSAVTIINNNAEALPNFRCNPADPADCSRRFASTGLRTTSAGLGAAPNPGFATLGVTGAKADFGLGNRARSVVWSSNLEWGGEALRLNLITGVVETAQDYVVDLGDGRALPSPADPAPGSRGFANGAATTVNQGRHRQFSQEARLTGRLWDGRVDYVAGVLFLNESNRTDVADIATDSLGQSRLLADRRIDSGGRSVAIYAQADALIVSNVQLTAGLRYTDETRRFDISDNRPACAGSNAATCLNSASLATAGVAIPTRQSVRDLSPRLALAWLPTDHITLFGSASRGYRTAGWNARGLTADTQLPFGREQAWSYEAGLRSDWFQQRLRVNLTGFILDVDGLQTPVRLGGTGPGAGTLAIGNDASLNTIGLEAELVARPLPALNLWLNAGWQRGRLRARGGGNLVAQQADCRAQLAAGGLPLLPGTGGAPACAAGVVAANGELARPQRTPQLSVAAGASYDLALPAAGIILTPSADVLWRSQFEAGAAGETVFAAPVTAGGITYSANPFGGGAAIAGSRVGSALLVNAGLALRTDDGNWTLAVECFNCFDAVFTEAQDRLVGYPTPPRSWQLRLKRVF